MSLTYKQAYKQKDEIIWLLKKSLHSEDIDKVANFYLDLSDVHVQGVEWPSDLYDEEHELVNLFVTEIHTNDNFKEKIVGSVMEIYENDSDSIIFIKMLIAIMTLVVTGVSIVKNCTNVLKNRKKRVGFGKDK